MVRPPRLPVCCLALVAGCRPFPDLSGIPVCDTLDTDPECVDLYGSSGGGSGGMAPTSGGEGTTVHGETTAADAGMSTGSDDGTSTTAPATTGEASAGPPEVVHAVIFPAKVEAESDLEVEVVAKAAEGVRMTVDGGAPVELAAKGEALFAGTIPVYSGLANGTHAVAFTAWAGELVSAPYPLEFAANLPQAGSEALWDPSGALGPGMAVSVAVDGDRVYELGTLDVDGEDRCYLKRRDANGNYGDADVRLVAPDQPCTAKSVATDVDGSVYVLAMRQTIGLPRWWLGRLDVWDGVMLNVAWGTERDVGGALAARPGTVEVAVCSTTPTGVQDVTDVRVAMFRKNGPGLGPPPFDYVPEGIVHEFRETARDCVYRDGVLAVVGEAYGAHDGLPAVERDRLFVLEVDTLSGEGTWKVLPKEGLAENTSAWGVAVGGEGDYFTVGYACGEPCVPELEIRRLLPGGEPGGWSVFPGLGGKMPVDIAWSPAGYLMIVAARFQQDWWTDFWVQAWYPGTGAPQWTYDRSDAPSMHAAFAVAAGAKGRVYTAGVAVQADDPAPVFVVLNP